MLKVLVEFEAWSVCETDESQDKTTANEVYAEHYRDCDNDDEDIEEGNSEYKASWSWEFDDPPGDKGYEVCWECYARVPEEVVALVQLYNWGRRHRRDE